MSLQTISYRTFRVLRRTDVLVAQQDVEAVVSGLLTGCPVTPAQVEVVLRGTDLTGTVTVTGEVGGAPASEDLVFTGPVAGTTFRVMRTCALFDCVTAITTTGLADEVPLPTIEARYRSEGNHAVPVNAEILDCLEGSREPVSLFGGKWTTQVQGSVEEQPSVIGFEDLYDYRPKVGDHLVELEDDPADERIWEVVGPMDHLGSRDPRTWEVGVLLRQAADLRILPTP